MSLDETQSATLDFFIIPSFEDDVGVESYEPRWKLGALGKECVNASLSRLSS